MGASQSIQKINFEDIQTVIKNAESYLLINTLPYFEQDCLIRATLQGAREEELINHHIRHTKHLKIIIYGRNCNDETIYKKYNQLLSLGFYNIYVYVGGLFEWLLLQDIYTTDLFPTTTAATDMLKYKPSPKLNVSLLEY